MNIEINYEEFVELRDRFESLEKKTRAKASADYDKELSRCLQPYTELKEKMGYVSTGEGRQRKTKATSDEVLEDVFTKEDLSKGFGREDIMSALDEVDKLMEESIYKGYFFTSPYYYDDFTVHIVLDKEKFIADELKKLTTVLELWTYYEMIKR